MKIDAVIIMCIYQQSITGSHFNVFEHYIKVLEYNPDVKLVFLLFTPTTTIIDYYIKIYEERYKLEHVDTRWKEGILGVKYGDFKHYKFNRVLILDFGTIPPMQQFLKNNCKELTVVSELHTENPKLFFDKNVYPVTYYGEMPFVYKDHQYRMRYNLDLLKDIDNPKDALFVTSRADDDVIEEKLKLFPNKPVLKRLKAEHIPNFLGEWDELLYIRTPNWYDSHPRCFIEAEYYGRKMHYFNDEGVKDGGWYRWLDIQERGIEDRQLTKDDVIIQKLI